MPRATSRSNGIATRALILQTAERLFAQSGFEGVSVRDITTASKVETGLINYHFKSKVALFREVLSMRVGSVCAQQIELIERVTIREADPLCVAELLEALTRPFVGHNRSATKKLDSYRKLLAQASTSRRWQSHVMDLHYKQVAPLFADKLNEVLPHADPVTIYRSVSFFLGTLINVYAQPQRLQSSSRGAITACDMDEIQRQLIRFTVGGLIQLTNGVTSGARVKR